MISQNLYKVFHSFCHLKGSRHLVLAFLHQFCLFLYFCFDKGNFCLNFFKDILHLRFSFCSRLLYVYLVMFIMTCLSTLEANTSFAFLAIIFNCFSLVVLLFTLDGSVSRLVWSRPLALKVKSCDTSYATLSSGIPWNVLYFLSIVYTKRIQVTSVIFHGMPRESVA